MSILNAENKEYATDRYDTGNGADTIIAYEKDIAQVALEPKAIHKSDSIYHHHHAGGLITETLATSQMAVRLPCQIVDFYILETEQMLQEVKDS